MVSLTLRVNAVVPPASRAAALGVIFAVGGVFALLANPLFGQLSDRTTSRFGMRRPWLVAGGLAGLAGLAVIGSAGSLTGILIGWAIAQTGFNATLAASTALLSDQVPPHQRSRVAGLLGTAQIVGILAGTAIAGAFAGDPLLLMLAPAGLLVVALPLLLAVLPDRRLHPRDRPPLPPRTVLATFTFDPRRHPDFARAWLARFFGVYGIATVLSFQALYLSTRLGVPDAQLAAAVLRVQLVQQACIIAAALLAGWLADRYGHAKRWVLAGSLVQGAGLLALAAASSLPGALSGIAAIGLAQGMLVSVGLPLALHVLPDPANAAKDLGVLNIAAAGPSALAPAVGPALIAAGGFSLLFLTAAGAATAGGAIVTRITASP